jgi:hypothetical protein
MDLKEGDYKLSHFKSGAIQLLIGIAILSLGLCALYAMSKHMDRAVHQYEIDKEHLGADYGTIFKTSLNRVHLLNGVRIPNARFVYALESQEPLALWHPSLFPTIKLHPGTWWPYGTYPWITKCLYRPSGLEGAEGETFVYCDDTMQHVCVLGYYGNNETYLRLFPTAIGARTPDEMLKTGKYEKIVEFDVPESVTSDEIFAFYTAQFQKVQWKLQPSTDTTARKFLSGERHAGVQIEKNRQLLHVRAFIESQAR